MSVALLELTTGLFRDLDVSETATSTRLQVKSYRRYVVNVKQPISL